MKNLLIAVCLVVLFAIPALAAKQAIAPGGVVDSTLFFSRLPAFAIVQVEQVDESEVFTVYLACTGEKIYHPKITAIDIGADGSVDKIEVRLCDLDWSSKSLEKMFKVKKIFSSSELSDANPILVGDLEILRAFLAAAESQREQDIIDGLGAWFDLEISLVGDFVE